MNNTIGDYLFNLTLKEADLRLDRCTSILSIVHRGSNSGRDAENRTRGRCIER